MFVTAAGRDLRIDMLRGLCVLVMVVNHISGASPLYLLTGGDQFLTSAAEGFIIVSGFTAGMVYRRLVMRDGLVPAMLKALRRAFSLYLLTVGLTLFLVPLSEALGLQWATGLDLSRSLKFVVSVLTLHRSYTFVNILVLYTLLFLALPLALLLMEQGRARWVLGASWLLWLVYQVYPEPATFPWYVEGGLPFAFSGWQVLFFSTLMMGYYRDRLPKLTQPSLKRLHLLTGLLFVAVLAAFLLLRLPADKLPATISTVQALVLDTFFDKASIGPGRIVASVAVFGFLLLSLTRWWRPLSQKLQRFLLPFGQHALYAWTVHILVIVGVGLVLKAFHQGEDNAWLNTGLQLGAAALIWFLTARQFLAVTNQNRRYWYAVPAVLALLALLVLQLPSFDAPRAASAAPAPVRSPAALAQPEN